MELLTVESILLFFLVLTRNTGMLLVAPIFGTGHMPHQLKIALSFGLTVIMFPLILSQATGSIPDNLPVFAIAAAKELLVGVLIGFVAMLMFTSIQLAGEYISHLMGLSIANVVDPVTHLHVPVIGQFYYILAILIFLFIDGHHWLFAAVQTSYMAVPAGFDFPQFPMVAEKIVILSSQMFMIALMLIAPVLGILFVTEIALGFMAKVMPQMNIFVVGLPLKIYIGLALILMLMPMTKIFIDNVFLNLCYQLYKLFI
ncbi:MAG: flagellar biosynthetic protein FliR [Cyanobacteriota bacterium]